MPKRKRTKTTPTTPHDLYYDTLPYRSEGKRYTVYLCRKCMKAWRLSDPVETWRLKSLLSHTATHVEPWTIRLRRARSTPQK